MHEIIAKSILSSKNGMNIYRGCLHGCIYCDSRSTCYQMNHIFEDVEIKINACELLEDKLKRKRKKCMIGTGSMSDPYMPIEKEYQLMRRCLEIICKYEFGCTVLTKSNLILRDIDLLKEINRKSKCVVQMTLTTFNENLCRILEPNVCTTYERFKVLKILSDNGIPTVVWLSPFLPFINDTKANILGLLSYLKDAKVKGIICYGIGVTMRDGNREYFYKKLDRYFPGLKDKYMKKFNLSYCLNSDNNNYLMTIIINFCKANDIMYDIYEVFKYLEEL